MRLSTKFIDKFFLIFTRKICLVSRHLIDDAYAVFGSFVFSKFNVVFLLWETNIFLQAPHIWRL